MKINTKYYEKDIAKYINDESIDISENIINWYDFKKDASVLNVGESKSNYLKELCKKCKSVTTIPLSKESALALAEKFKDIDNFEILLGDFDNIKFMDKYDFILLYGILELSSLLNCNKGLTDFFNKIKTLLKDDGRLLVINDNPYGIKYFANNYTENYKDYKYDISNYKFEKYGKKEIEDCLNDSGFDFYRFLYPFPDYKNPIVIYSDYKKPSIDECYSLPLFNYGFQSYLFDPRIIMAEMLRNDKFDFFSNSFMIEASKNNNLSDVCYVKQQPCRNDNYKTITVIDRNDNVKKIACTDESHEHLEKMVMISNKIKDNDLKTASLSLSKNVLEIEYIKGKNVYNLICDYIKNNDYNKIDKEIEEYIKYVRSTSTYKKIKNPISDSLFGLYKDKTHILKVSLLDFNMGNVIKYDNEYYLIDQEWYSDLELPVDYVIYFSIKLLFESINNIESIIDYENLLCKYDINEDKRSIFDSISSDYFKNLKLNNQDKYWFFYHNSKINYLNEIFEKRINDVSASYEKKIDGILNSKSWKITKPIRIITEHLKK